MDPGRNRPSRPRLRSHGNPSRVLVFDQVESEDHKNNPMEPETARRSLPAKVESKEAPVRACKYIYIYILFGIMHTCSVPVD